MQITGRLLLSPILSQALFVFALPETYLSISCPGACLPATGCGFCLPLTNGNHVTRLFLTIPLLLLTVHVIQYVGLELLPEALDTRLYGYLVASSTMQSSPMSQSQPPLHSTQSKSTRDALITTPAAPVVELRQNNPQDCANLIAASVDRATVEISRTIIALNATFSQQLQQASISASNGIKSAENSASSSISIVSLNASSATSSASFSLNLANLAVTSVNSALTNANLALASAQSQVVGVNLVLTSALSASTSDVLRLSSSLTDAFSASTSDVSRLSSSLSSLEANLVSVKVTTSPLSHWKESTTYSQINRLQLPPPSLSPLWVNSRWRTPKWQQPSRLHQQHSQVSWSEPCSPRFS